jgi:putative ABC transport system permease protein
MSLRRFVGRFFSLVKRERSEQELARELSAHLTLLEDDFIARGMSREDAAIAARRALGGVDQTKERHRDARSFIWLEDLRRDVPYAIRGLVRSPGFTAAAVTTLALGIGATTAVFGVVNAVLLQPLPYKDSDQLVRIIERAAARNSANPPLRRTSMSWAELAQWRAQTTTLSAMAYALNPPITLMPTATGSARLTGTLLSANTFHMLGARAQLGRTLDERDEAAGSNVVVISSSAWQRFFQGDPGSSDARWHSRRWGLKADSSMARSGPSSASCRQASTFRFRTPITGRR